MNLVLINALICAQVATSGSKFLLLSLTRVSHQTIVYPWNSRAANWTFLCSGKLWHVQICSIFVSQSMYTSGSHLPSKVGILTFTLPKPSCSCSLPLLGWKPLG